MRRRPFLLALAAICAVALALRLFGLDHKSVWFDEAITFFAASTQWSQLLESISHDVHPPLSYVLYHLWPPVTAGDFWLRFPSAVLGALAAPVSWLWARRIASPAEAVTTGLIVAVMPLQVDLAQEARMYGLFLLLTATSLWLLDRLLARPSLRTAIPYALVAAAMLYTHYYAAFLLAAEGVAIVAALGAHRSGARLALGALVLAGASFLPWLPVLAAQAQAIRGDYWIEAPGLTTLWVTFRDLAAHTPPDEPFRFLLRVAYVAQAALLVVGVIASLRCARQRVAVALIAVPVGLAFLVSLDVGPIYGVRYLSPIGLGFAFLLARGVFSGARAAVLPGALFAVLPMLLSLWFLYFDPGYSRSDLRAAAHEITARRASNEVVIHLSDGSVAPFDYYRVPQPSLVLGTMAPAELCRALAGHPGAWLVVPYAADDEVARAQAEADVAASAGDLIADAPIRLLGVSVFRLGSGCNV